MRLVSWNIDGLEPSHRGLRLEAVCRALMALHPLPDVMMMQEVIGPYCKPLQELLGRLGYRGFPTSAPREVGYFCMLWVRTEIFSIEACRVEPFAGSGMGRALLWAKLRRDGVDLWVRTSHFESLGAGAAERKRQASEVFSRLRSFEGPAIFAGDTNLRDREFDAFAQRPEDAWAQCGSSDATRYTWDLVRNQNKKVSYRPIPRKRYDRVFLNGHDGWRAVHFSLLGEEPFVHNAQSVWPSDHFGVLVDLEGL